MAQGAEGALLLPDGPNRMTPGQHRAHGGPGLLASHAAAGGPAGGRHGGQLARLRALAEVGVTGRGTGGGGCGGGRSSRVTWNEVAVSLGEATGRGQVPQDAAIRSTEPAPCPAAAGPPYTHSSLAATSARPDHLLGPLPARPRRSTRSTAGWSPAGAGSPGEGGEAGGHARLPLGPRDGRPPVREEVRDTRPGSHSGLLGLRGGIQQSPGGGGEGEDRHVPGPHWALGKLDKVGPLLLGRWSRSH